MHQPNLCGSATSLVLPAILALGLISSANQFADYVLYCSVVRGRVRTEDHLSFRGGPLSVPTTSKANRPALLFGCLSQLLKILL